MSPAAHALDRRLHALRAAHEGVTASLLELESEETYQVLTAHDGLSGTTAAKARPALARLAELRPGLDLLGELLQWAGGLRNSTAMDDHRATELVSLLNSPSLVVPAPAAPAVPGLPGPAGALGALGAAGTTATGPVPGQSGGSGPGATHTVSPQDLLDSLEQAVVPLRAVVTEVDSAWRELPLRLERVAAEAERLALELPAFRSVAIARATLADLPTRVVHDPLGAADDLGRVQSSLAAATGARTEVARLGRILQAATTTLTEIESLIDEGGAALGRSVAEIHEPWGLLDPIDPDVLAGERGLRPWLGRLERLVAAGDVGPAEKGLASWQALADQTLGTARQVAAANGRPVARRHELQRLLGAAVVKARASGRADDPRVVQLADQAHRALLVPCDIDQAEIRVDAYIDALRRKPTVGPERREMSA
ncbi:MAG TPA: hypothetical protein VGO78_25680 [Acidimicrobiales bacterium]|nr:hypothetical protein [Acidimicrobiales bacterium]